MTFSLSDKSFACADCGQIFTVSVAEQLFYAEHGSRLPTRCPECRASRRAERHADAIRAVETSAPSPTTEGYGGYSGFATSSGGARGRGQRAGGPVMYTAVCSACGASASVPFEPRGRRPVYCRNCFNARRGR